MSIQGEYNGSATVMVHFRNRVEWQKWRKYILKTDWDFDEGNGPLHASFTERFSCMDDIERIVKRIIQLMQMGFDVYTCNWKLIPKDEIECGYWAEDGEYKVFRLPATDAIFEGSNNNHEN